MSLQPSRDFSWREGHQDVLNAHPVPERNTQTTAPNPVAVRARIVWAREGEELIATLAVAWTSQLVLVELADARCAVRGVWLEPADVQRT